MVVIPETVALPSTTKSEIIPTRPLKVEIPVNVDKPVTDKFDAIDTSDDAVRFPVTVAIPSNDQVIFNINTIIKICSTTESRETAV